MQKLMKTQNMKKNKLNKIALRVVAADTSANSARWAAISPNARHKSRQRCPCGKKLSVALISLETDALDILTSGVNNTNSKKEKKKKRDGGHSAAR